jgi:hypothetical protein
MPGRVLTQACDEGVGRHVKKADRSLRCDTWFCQADVEIVRPVLAVLVLLLSFVDNQEPPVIAAASALWLSEPCVHGYLLPPAAPHECFSSTHLWPASPLRPPPGLPGPPGPSVTGPVARVSDRARNWPPGPGATLIFICAPAVMLEGPARGAQVGKAMSSLCHYVLRPHGVFGGCPGHPPVRGAPEVQDRGFGQCVAMGEGADGGYPANYRFSPFPTRGASADHPRRQIRTRRLGTSVWRRTSAVRGRGVVECPQRRRGGALPRNDCWTRWTSNHAVGTLLSRHVR